jgi:hypothetical protein
VNPPAPIDPTPVNPPAPIDPTPVNPPEPIPVPVELPAASFEKNVIDVAPQMEEAVARILLNKPSDVPVYLNVEANSESAKQSFEPYSERVMIPANQTSVEVKVKIVRQDICCRTPAPRGDVTVGQFKIKVTSIENATMAEPQATVVVKDNATRCAPPAPEPQPEPVTPPAPVMPKARFEQPRLSGDKASQVTAKILLDIPAAQDVVIDLETQDGTAKGDIDYGVIKKSLTIKAGESSVDVPVTLLPRDKCAPNADAGEGSAGEFALVVTNITNAEMSDKAENIAINEDTRTCEPKPEITAKFESLALSNQRGSKDIIAKIVLNQASDLPVMIDIETQESTAKQDVDFVPLTASLVIPPGQTAIEIPLKLADSKCVPPDLLSSLNLAKQFNLVVTKIENATMLEPAASVSITDDPVVCEPEPQPQPPVEPPAPVEPTPKPQPTPPAPPVQPPAPVIPTPKPQPTPPAPPVQPPAPAPVEPPVAPPIVVPEPVSPPAPEPQPPQNPPVPPVVNPEPPAPVQPPVAPPTPAPIPKPAPSPAPRPSPSPAPRPK